MTARPGKWATDRRRWHTLRMAVLERDGFRCRHCGARGRLEVDHVQPVRTYPGRAFDPSNLQALCGGCHSRKTLAERGVQPLGEDRHAWRQSVVSLERSGSRGNRHTGAKTCLSQ